MNKKISLGATIAYMAIIAAITFSLTKIYSINEFNNMMKNISERESTYDKLSEIDLFVRDNYYGQIDSEAVLSSTAAGYIAGLGDKNSRYMTPQEYEAYSNVDTGKYVGIGIVTEQSEDGYMRVKLVYPESPAQFAGLKAGDIIVSIDGKACNQENYAELALSLKGDAGSKVTIVKRTENEEATLEITRRDVDVPTVQSGVLSENVGLLKITAVTQATAKQMEKAVKQLTENGVTSFVIDVRGVSSTSEEHVVAMLSSIVPEGDIAFKVFQDGSKKSIGASDGAGIKAPIVVLADEETKGTIEIFVLAVKELENGKFVGTVTGGKGSVQEAFKLSDGSAILLTTAVYSSRGGRTYDTTGVFPNYDVKLTENGEDKTLIMGDLNTDTQLRKALEVALAATKSAEISK